MITLGLAKVSCLYNSKTRQQLSKHIIILMESHSKDDFLHVLPAAAKRENKLDEFAIAKLPLKKQKLIKKKAEASTIHFQLELVVYEPGRSQLFHS